MFRSNEEIILTAILGTLIIVVLCVIIIVAIIKYKVRQKHFLKETESLNSFFQQEILRTQLEIQEQTFKNISQEIHDNIGQMLSLAKLNINTMNAADPADLQEKIRDSRNLIGKSIQDLRDLSKSMNTDFVAEIGLLKAIAYEMDLLKKANHYDTGVELEGTPIQLPAQQELILFRIVQEALNNIIKHAKASCIQVQIRFKQAEITLRITDDGQGFEAAAYADGSRQLISLGIRNMQNRARLINAAFVLESQPGCGTTIQIKVPINPQTETA